MPAQADSGSCFVTTWHCPILNQMGNGYCLTDTVISASIIKIIKKLLNFFLLVLRTDCLLAGAFPALMLRAPATNSCARFFIQPSLSCDFLIPVGQCSYVLGIFCLLPVRVCEQNLHLWEPHCGEHAVVFSFWLMVLVLHHLASDRLH